MIRYLRQLFCRHRFKWTVRNEQFTASRYTRVYACEKCGKVKWEVVVDFDYSDMEGE